MHVYVEKVLLRIAAVVFVCLKSLVRIHSKQGVCEFSFRQYGRSGCEMKLQNNQTSIITKDKKCTWIYAIKVVDISTLIKAHGYGQAFNEGFARRPCWMAGTRQILLSGKINIFFMQKYFIVSAIQHGQVSQAKMGKKVLVKMFSAIAWIVFLLFGLFVGIQAHASWEYFVRFLRLNFSFSLNDIMRSKGCTLQPRDEAHNATQSTITHKFMHQSQKYL